MDSFVNRVQEHQLRARHMCPAPGDALPARPANLSAGWLNRRSAIP
jgi:hypothetical protein